MSRFDRNQEHRAGMTLMEVILALAILAGAMLLIGELTRIGGRHAQAALDVSRGQLHCQSVLAQIDAGILTATPTQNMPVDTDPDWLYSIDIQPQATPGLLAVTVSAIRADQARTQPPTARLVRWMVDPQYVQQRVNDAAEQAAEEDTSVL